MYIIVNKQVLNVFNLRVSEIKKFDNDELVKIATSIYSMSHSDDDVKNKKVYNFAKDNKWFEKDNTSFDWKADHQFERIYKFDGVKEGYYFFVEDDNHLLISKLYTTERTAENARDELLRKANYIIARLYKVEI